MPTLSPDDSEALAALIGVYGEGIVEQYAKATFPTVLIKLRNLTAKNASNWINIQRFTDWIVTASQNLDDTLPAGQSNTALALDSTPLASPRGDTCRRRIVRIARCNLDALVWLYDPGRQLPASIPKHRYRLDNAVAGCADLEAAARSSPRLVA